MLRIRRRSRVLRSPVFVRRYMVRHRALVIIVPVLLILLIGLGVAVARMRPIVESLSRAKVRDVVLHAISMAVEAEVSGGELDYNRLITIEKDAGGNISALISNMALVNTLQMRIADGIVQNVETLSSADMSIPVGNVMGGILFASRGPKIPIRIQSITNVYTEFENSFASAGINQTRHRITLQVSAEIDILIPGMRSEAVVETEVLIAETIIVGVVPNLYVGE